MSNSETDKATYTFEEAIERIRICTDRNELVLLAGVLDEEKREYSIYHLRLIQEAFNLKAEEFNLSK